MDLKEIQTLVKLVSSSKVDHLEIDKKDFSLKIKKNSNKTEVVSVAAPAAAPVQQSASAPVAPASTPAAPEAPAQAEAPAPNGVEVKSPMIGTFYRSAGPDKPAFVEVGDEIKVGQTICIVEAMKLFNEIEAEVAGKVVKVCVDDASPVEYDQPLFIVEPV